MNLDQLELQCLRLEAYKNDDYTLDEWEGFTCTECGWRGLTAPGDIDSHGLHNYCPECESESLETSGMETKWEVVSEKIPKVYHTGEAMETDLPECDKCERDIRDNQEIVTVSIGEKNAELHEGCSEAVWRNSIENEYWYDTFTEEHYEAAITFFREFESIGCIVVPKHGYEMGGELFIHTNYATTSIVGDVTDAFGGRVVSAHMTPEDDENSFNCVKEHGTCFEILIDFCADEPTRREPAYLDTFSHTEFGGDARVSEDYFYREYGDEPRYQPTFDANFDQ